MTLALGSWIHSFTVTDTATHKKGYTIYKITSVIFPRSVPQALTCITVWKRFHDVKRLHRELCRRQKVLQLNCRIPEPIDCSFFKRFDVGVIQSRKKYILELLDFVAQHPELYKSHVFSEFFANGHSPGSTPPHRVMGESDASAIAEICDSLDMTHDEHQLNLPNSERQNSESVNDKNDVTKTVREVSASTENEVFAEDNQPTKVVIKDVSRFLTPMASIESDDSEYIYEAALLFSKAVQAEANIDYKEAHMKYKKGVEVLRNGIEDDDNDERKLIAKTKISKYSARADDIFEKFFKRNTANGTAFQLTIDLTGNHKTSDCEALCLERPWSRLVDYKILRILSDRVMQVQSISESMRTTYVMKGIEKPSSNSAAQAVFLPQGVPYMVDLVAFFQSEQKLFLLLKQAEGGRLYDYVLSYKPLTTKPSNLNRIFPEVNDTETSDSSNFSAQDSGFVFGSPVTAPTLQAETSELLYCSQQLLKSVSNTLKSSESGESREAATQPYKITKPAKVQVHEEHMNELQDVHTPKLISLPEACLKQWASELTVAIHELHSKGVILGDLHMDNLLLGSKGQLLLTYFHQNESWNADTCVHKAFNPLALAGHYVAPERPLTTRSDWWSYGVILYQLLLGLSFKEAHPGRIDLYGCVRYPDMADISNSARDLLENLLVAVPEQRFGYEDIRRHSFFEGIDWDEVLRKGIA